VPIIPTSMLTKRNKNKYNTEKDFLKRHGEVIMVFNVRESYITYFLHMCRRILIIITAANMVRLREIEEPGNIYIFITYLLLYPVNIKHYINSNYYTEYFYATHNIRNVTSRPILSHFDCDVTKNRQFYVGFFTK
jgi:hypothetical protein